MAIKSVETEETLFEHTLVQQMVLLHKHHLIKAVLFTQDTVELQQYVSSAGKFKVDVLCNSAKSALNLSFWSFTSFSCEYLSINSTFV